MLCTLFQPDMALGHEQKTIPEPDIAAFFFFFSQLAKYPIVSGNQTLSVANNKLKKMEASNQCRKVPTKLGENRDLKLVSAVKSQTHSFKVAMPSI